MTQIGHNSEGFDGGAVAADQLRLLLERVERLEEEKKGIADDIKNVWAEAKGRGFDVKAGKAILRIRRMKREQWQEEQAMVALYCEALGLA